MRMKKHIIIILAGMLALAGCNKEIDKTDCDSITVRASIGAMTKVADTGFADGDKIAVYAWTGDANAIPASRWIDGVVNTFDGAKWTPESQMLWKNSKESHYFLGICPVRSVSDFTADPYTLNPSDYDGSDLLVARNLDGLTSGSGDIDLQFNHLMAKLNVNLTFPGEWDAVPEVNSITVKSKTKATVNYLSATVTPSSDEAEAVNIPAASVVQGYDKSYSVLQIPQDGVRIIDITIGNTIYEYESASDIPLSAGKYTSLGLIVGREKAELADISVSDWTEEARISGVEALFDPSLTWEVETINCGFTYDNKPIAVNIDRRVADNALVVPITLNDASGLFSLSDTEVSFGAGEYHKTIYVNYDYSQLAGVTIYSFSLSFDEGLCGPRCIDTVVCSGYKTLEYEDYREGYYEGYYQVNASITAYEWIPGPLIENLDSEIWILQRAKGTSNYYKMIIWDGLAEIEFWNNGDGSFGFTKIPGYNDGINRWDTSKRRFYWSVTKNGDNYSFQTRASESELYVTGTDFVPGDGIELYGWVSKNGIWLGQNYNMYLEFQIIKPRHTVSIAGTTNGSIALVGNSPIQEDATVTLTVTPDDTYEVESLYYVIEGNTDHVDIALNANNEYSFTMPAGDITVYATFNHGKLDAPVIKANGSTDKDNFILNDNNTSISVAFEAADGATVYYSTDGTTPTEESLRIKPGEDFDIYDVCVIKAIAVKDGYTTSDVTTETVYHELVKEPLKYEQLQSVSSNDYWVMCELSYSRVNLKGFMYSRAEEQVYLLNDTPLDVTCSSGFRIVRVVLGVNNSYPAIYSSMSAGDSVSDTEFIWTGSLSAGNTLNILFIVDYHPEKVEITYTVDYY